MLTVLEAFYKKNNRWTEGLISAAKAVANSTNLLIETADGVIGGRNSPEQLIVASNDVAASTAQLVAASRVKASFMSKTQERLEDASKAVTGACRSLVKQVQAIIDARANGEEVIDYSKLSRHEFNRSYVFPSFFHINRMLTFYKQTHGEASRDSAARERPWQSTKRSGRDAQARLPRRRGMSDFIGFLLSLVVIPNRVVCSILTVYFCSVYHLGFVLLSL